MNNENEDSKKEIKIVLNEDGDNLDISTVFDHTINPTSNNKNTDSEKKEIVIPKSSSDKKN